MTDGTDRTEGADQPRSEAHSTLYALLEATSALGISRGDVDGALYHHTVGSPPAFVLFDNVAGGAGYAQRIADSLPELFRAAAAGLVSCDCGEDSSCYGCLRTYDNQNVHDRLSRAAATAVLTDVLGEAGDHKDLAILDDLARPFLRAVLLEGREDHQVGYELPGAHGWMVELAWPTRQVALAIDDDQPRDAWLAANGWRVIRPGVQRPAELRSLLADISV